MRCYSFKPGKIIISSFIILLIFTILTFFIYNIETSTSNKSTLLTEFDYKLQDSVEFEHLNVPLLDLFMYSLSDFGREYFWSFVMLGLFLFGKQDGRKTAIIIMISILIIIPANILLKDTIDRERPSFINNEFDGSYPSGHASIVSAGALVSALFFRNTNKKKIVLSVLLIEAALVCISRIYVESHYPFDVIGGILLGSGVALLVSNYAKSLDMILSYLSMKMLESSIYLKLRRKTK